MTDPSPSARARNQGIIDIGTLAVVGLAGAVVMLFATAKGIGLMPDSADYFAAARNLLAGHGLVVHAADGAFTPLVLWPPLYPLVLALAGLAGTALSEAGRLTAAFCFGGTVFLVGLSVRQYTGSRTAALLGGLLALCSASLLETQSWAQSEGLFTVMALLSLLLVDRYRHSGRFRVLLAGALVCGLACITRYGGVALIPAGIVVLAGRRSAPPRRRLFDSGVFLLFAAAPLVLWLVRNAVSTGSATGRAVLFHPMPGWKLLTALDTFASWLVTFSAPGPVKYAALIAAVTVISVLLTSRLRTRGRRGAARPVPRATALFLPLFLLTVVASITFLDAFIPLDSRMLSPLLPVAVVLAVRLGHAAWQGFASRRLARVALTLLAAGWLGLWVVQAGSWLAHRSRDGAWYTSAQWRNSEVLAAVRLVPDSIAVYSNVPEGVYLVTGRPAFSVPPAVDHHTGRPNHGFLTQMDSLRVALDRGEATLVYVGRETERRWYLPDERELVGRLGLAPVARFRDGTIYASRQILDSRFEILD